MFKKLKTKKIVKNTIITSLLISLGSFAVTADYSALTKNTGDTLTAANWTQLVNNVKGLITDSNGDIIVNQNLKVNRGEVEALAFIGDGSQLTGLDSLVGATGATGPAGIQGPMGLTGNTGAIGPAGTTSWVDSSGVVSTDGKVGIGTSNPTRNLEIDSDNTATIKLSGGGSNYTNADIRLTAKSNTNYRGLGIYMHDVNGNTSWYAGTPYTSSDQYQIGRLQSGNSSSELSNAFLTVKNSGNVGIGTNSPSEKLEVDGNIKALDIKTTSPWYDLLVPTGYTDYGAKCRKVNGWIEFRGRLTKVLSAGWPTDNTSVFLPAECRPLTKRYTETPCHAVSGPRNRVCNLDYYTDGRIGIYTDFAINQIRFEGVRIWGDN